jgi:hypothetical protein
MPSILLKLQKDFTLDLEDGVTAEEIESWLVANGVVGKATREEITAAVQTALREAPDDLIPDFDLRPEDFSIDVPDDALIFDIEEDDSDED